MPGQCLRGAEPEPGCAGQQEPVLELGCAGVRLGVRLYRSRAVPEQGCAENQEPVLVLAPFTLLSTRPRPGPYAGVSANAPTFTWAPPHLHGSPSHKGGTRKGDGSQKGSRKNRVKSWKGEVCQKNSTHQGCTKQETSTTLEFLFPVPWSPAGRRRWPFQSE